MNLRLFCGCHRGNRRGQLFCLILPVKFIGNKSRYKAQAKTEGSWLLRTNIHFPQSTAITSLIRRTSWAQAPPRTARGLYRPSRRLRASTIITRSYTIFCRPPRLRTQDGTATDFTDFFDKSSVQKTGDLSQLVEKAYKPRNVGAWNFKKCRNLLRKFRPVSAIARSERSERRVSAEILKFF